ncbi:MAG: SAM-dependent methyltransferase, partial [Acidobacteria bacterium]|nr:SAM-dependent methyltransferase [Acidobacteriota bacterium]
WRLSDGELRLEQAYQVVTGTLGSMPIANGRLRGDAITFTAGAAEYTGRVIGDRIEGTVRRGGTDTPWSATRTAR